MMPFHLIWTLPARDERNGRPKWAAFIGSSSIIPRQRQEERRVELEETWPSPVLLQPLWGDECGGLGGPRVKGEIDLCQKTEQTRPKKGLDKPSATFKIDLFRSREKKGSGCVCGACAREELAPQRSSLLPGWVIRSVSPRRLPAQCPGSLHKAGGTSLRKLLWWWREKRVSRLQRDISEIITPQTQLHLRRDALKSWYLFLLSLGEAASSLGRLHFDLWPSLLLASVVVEGNLTSLYGRRCNDDWTEQWFPGFIKS